MKFKCEDISDSTLQRAIQMLRAVGHNKMASVGVERNV